MTDSVTLLDQAKAALLRFIPDDVDHLDDCTCSWCEGTNAIVAIDSHIAARTASESVP